MNSYERKMGEGTYLDGMVKENFTEKVTFTMKVKGWQGLLNMKNYRKSVSRRNSKTKILRWERASDA